MDSRLGKAVIKRIPREIVLELSAMEYENRDKFHHILTAPVWWRVKWVNRWIKLATENEISL